MFQHDTIETRSKTIKIEDMTASTVEQILKYLYTGHVNLPEDINDQVELLEAADRYQLDALKSKCFNRLCRQISSENAGKLCVLAYFHNAEIEVMEKIRTFCIK